MIAQDLEPILVVVVLILLVLSLPAKYDPAIRFREWLDGRNDQATRRPGRRR